MESVFVSFVLFVLATLVYALRAVSRPVAPVRLPEADASSIETSRASAPQQQPGRVGRTAEHDEAAEPIRRRSLLDIA
jgi:Na+-transporting methylmalonyl-CoA/oxaloacetate decarboxylase gamma subunit